MSDDTLPQGCKISNLRDQWVSLGHQTRFGSNGTVSVPLEEHQMRAVAVPGDF